MLNIECILELFTLNFFQNVRVCVRYNKFEVRYWVRIEKKKLKDKEYEEENDKENGILVICLHKNSL